MLLILSRDGNSGGSLGLSRTGLEATAGSKSGPHLEDCKVGFWVGNGNILGYLRAEFADAVRVTGRCTLNKPASDVCTKLWDIPG